MNFLIPDRWAALAAQYPEGTVGRITLQEKGMYRIRTSMSEQNALVSGKFQFDAQSPSDYPAVGDYVMVSYADPDTAVIHQVLPRRSLFVRRAAGTSKMEQVVAANIDTVFLCMSLNNDFNLRRLERYLAATWESGAAPVVVLTKADLCEDVSSKQAEVETITMGVPILTTSAMDTDGYGQIMPYITEGRTVAFVGSSGVGKSTLINRLLGEERLATDGLRNDDKGRHTTTHRELLVLPNGPWSLIRRVCGSWACGMPLPGSSRPLRILKHWQPNAVSATVPTPVNRAAPSGPPSGAVNWTAAAGGLIRS